MKRYSKEVADFIKAKAGILTDRQISEQLKKQLGVTLDYESIHSWRGRHKIANPQKENRDSFIFTSEVQDLIAWFCTTMNDAELAEWLTNYTGKEVTKKQVCFFRKNRKIKCGRTGQFGERDSRQYGGQIKPGEHRGRATEFKKGHSQTPAAAINEIRISTNGYRKIKLGPKTWKLAARVEWERKNGPIPEGMKLVRLDGNRLNDEPENLRLVSDGVVGRMHGLFYKGQPELVNALLSVKQIEEKVGGIK